MADIIINLDKTKYNDPDQFFDHLLANIDNVLDKALESYADDTAVRWKNASNSGTIPGDFTQWWIDRKAEWGLKTEPLQRLGQGDPRSYYENIVSTRFSHGRGWFVGVKKGLPAYNVYKPKDGPVVVYPRKSDVELHDIAEIHESLGRTIWTKLWSKSPRYIFESFHRELLRFFQSLGAGDTA